MAPRSWSSHGDPAKAASNVTKHGVTFAQAATVLLDALATRTGFRAQPAGAGVLQLELAQAWADGGRLSSRLPVAIGAN